MIGRSILRSGVVQQNAPGAPTGYAPIPPPPASYFVNRRDLGPRTPDEQAAMFFAWAQRWWPSGPPTCSSWLSGRPGTLPLLTLLDPYGHPPPPSSQESARDWWAHAFLLFNGPESGRWYDYDKQAALLVQAITNYCRQQQFVTKSTIKAP